MSKKVVIIGAGPGGLTSGMILAHRGFDVTIVEKAPRVGGRSAAIREAGYTFDTGPTFLHQKFTLDEVFAEAGRSADEMMEFVKLDPMTTLTWGDLSMSTSCEPETMKASIEKAFPGEGRNFERFMADHAKKLKTIFPCLRKPYHKLSSLLNKELLLAFPYVATRKSVMEALDDYFTDVRLKLAFTFQAKYLGMSPWKCPALFTILSYIEYAHGIYHVQGGLCKISETMSRVVQESGGRLLLNSEVKEIHFSGRQATGVELGDGKRIECDHLIVNADYSQAKRSIFGESNETTEQLKKKKYSCSTFMLYLGLDIVYEDEPHHHIIFADDYRRNVSEIQSEKTVSDDMSIYIRNSSVTDPNVAPPGHSQLYILVPTINNRHGDSWQDDGDAYREKILSRIIERTGMKDLRERIVFEKRLTPRNWEEENVFMGATFNLAHTLDQMLYLRPRNKMSGFDNVYLVGGGTHPGSGLPTIYESGRISANLICEVTGIRASRVDFSSEILRKAAATG